LSNAKNIRCTFNFGHYGKFAINLSLEDKDLAHLQNNRFKEHSISEVIKQLALEYIIGLRSTVEQVDSSFNYDNLIYVNIDGQKVDAKEIHKIMNEKQAHLLRHTRCGDHE
jgi:hypothetical protein